MHTAVCQSTTGPATTAWRGLFSPFFFPHTFSTEQPGVSFLPNLLTYQSEKGVKSLSFVSSAMTAQLEVWNHRSCEHDAKKLEMVTGHELVAKDDKGGQADKQCLLILPESRPYRDAHTYYDRL